MLLARSILSARHSSFSSVAWDLFCLNGSYGWLVVLLIAMSTYPATAMSQNTFSNNRVTVFDSSLNQSVESDTALHRVFSARQFLDSIGVVTSTPGRGQPIDKTSEMIQYTGFRWVRGGIAGFKNKKNNINDFVWLHEQTDVKFSWGLLSGGNDINLLLNTASILADHDALLAIEGNNEPGNWGVKFNGQLGGGSKARSPSANSWLPIAKLQAELYKRVSTHSKLKDYPVWSVSDVGAQSDNVGLQYLEIPDDADTLMPDGTKYADFANVHNYIYQRRSPKLEDNKVWNAADPSSRGKGNGLYKNFGRTWAKGYKGYGPDQLHLLPRVATETGARIRGKVTERVHALNLLNMYLAQFKRGYTHTAIYLLRDRTDEKGNQKFGFFKPDYTPRLAAIYLRNLTTILADDKSAMSTDRYLQYNLIGKTVDVHDLVLQKSDGRFYLIIWGEKVSGASDIFVKFVEKINKVDVYYPIASSRIAYTKYNTESLDIQVADQPIILAFNKR